MYVSVGVFLPTSNYINNGFYFLLSSYELVITQNINKI